MSVAAGEVHTCSVIDGAANCWGFNAAGRLGNGTATDSLFAVQVQGLTIGVTAIAAGSDGVATRGRHYKNVMGGLGSPITATVLAGCHDGGPHLPSGQA
jgi:Regulator of chromosome condensation (RCC1) repeat